MMPDPPLCDNLGFGVFSVEMSNSGDGVLARFGVVLVEMSSSCGGVLARFGVVLVEMSSSCGGFPGIIFQAHILQFYK